MLYLRRAALAGFFIMPQIPLAAQEVPNVQRNPSRLEQSYSIEDSEPIPPEEDGSLEEEVVIGDGLRERLRKPKRAPNTQFVVGKRVPNFWRSGRAGIGEHLTLTASFKVTDGTPSTIVGSDETQRAKLLAIARVYLEQQGAEELGSASEEVTFTVTQVALYNREAEQGGGSVAYSRDVSGVQCIDGNATVDIDAEGRVVRLEGVVFDVDAIRGALAKPKIERTVAENKIAALAPKETLFVPNSAKLTCRSTPPYITWEAATSARIYRIDAASGVEVPR